MASKTSFHVRSNSLPSKPHPLIAEADEHLCRLRASSETTSSSSSSSASRNLSGLCELYDCVGKLLLLPLTQQSLAQVNHEVLLDGSLRLLDLCETAKDFLLQTKEFVRQLKSALRRRRRSEVGFENELISRKTIKKGIQKVLKGIERKKVEKKEENSAVIGLLKEVESVTFEAVKSVLSVISGSKSASKRSNWSIVSTIMRSKRVAIDDEESDVMNAIDVALQSLTSSSKTGRSTHLENLHNSLEKLESEMQDFEENLDGLCRQLIKTRVSLLNIFNH